MKVTLFDINPSMVAAWAAVQWPEFVEIKHCSFDELEPHTAIVSPANSFGFMDGGIDSAYSRFFGPKLQSDLQSLIVSSGDGEILVGAAMWLYTMNQKFKVLISAPTMRTPRRIIDLDAVRLSTRAAFKCAKEMNFDSIAIPGMGAFSGGVPVDVCAQFMKRGFDDVFNPKPFPASWREAAAS